MTRQRTVGDEQGGSVTGDLMHELYAGAYRRLVGQLYAVCGDLHEAEDVVAEAFARGVQHRRKLESADSPEAWLRTVALNVARSRWRRKAVATRLKPLLAVPASQPSSSHPDLSVDRLALVQGLARLPAGQREVIALHYFADLPVHEVAQTLGIPAGTVKARLSRGRAGLAKLLADGEYPGQPIDAHNTPQDHHRSEGASHA